MTTFRYTLMEMPGHDIEIEADYFLIQGDGTLVFYECSGDDGDDRIIRAVNARVWRVVE